MPIEAYFDGSNVDGWTDGKCVTLAGFVSEDDIWVEIDKEWTRILAGGNGRPPARYLHMREAARFDGEFSHRNGWNERNVSSLLIDLLMYLQTVDKNRFRYFYCFLDLEAHRRVLADGIELPDPLTMCLEVPKSVLNWYFVKWPGVIDSADFFFDKDEPFKEPFEKKWKHEKDFSLSGADYVWSMIKTITTADMRDNPGLQAADLAAWTVNRKNWFKGKDLLFQNIELFMKEIIPSAFIIWDEQRLREQRGRIVPV